MYISLSQLMFSIYIAEMCIEKHYFLNVLVQFANSSRDIKAFLLRVLRGHLTLFPSYFLPYFLFTASGDPVNDQMFGRETNGWTLPFEPFKIFYTGFEERQKSIQSVFFLGQDYICSQQ